MTTNIQQFIEKQRKKGIPDDEIYAFLQSKGVDIKQKNPKPMFGSRGTTGGLFGFLTPAISTLPQAAGQAFGQKENLKTVEGLSSTIQSQSDVAVRLLKQIQQEKDPNKKERLRTDLKNIASDVESIGKIMNQLSSGEGVTKSTEIKIPNILEAPALRPGMEGVQQVAGRSIRQIATSTASQLGATGTGALYGLGSGIERGSSASGIAAETAVTATAFKLFGYGTEKFAGSKIGQKVISSPFGSSVLNLGNKVFSPFLAKPASYTGGITVIPKTYEGAVETQIKNFGNIVDKTFSPTAYRDFIKKGLTTVGKEIGFVGKPEEQLANAQQKVTKYWTDAKNRYQTSMRYDDKSPEVLGREGIIPKQMGGSMGTADQAEIVRTKAAAEHSLLNRIAQESQIYRPIEEARQAGIKQITQNLQGAERETALNEFNKQFDALLSQNKESIIGEGRIPIKLLNDFKSYMWGQGYANKLAPKSDQIAASAMRSGGNGLKNYINSAFQQEDPAMAEAVIRLNEHSGELFQAAKFLEFMNGKRLPGGFLGRYFARVIGAVVGSSAGPLGTITGSITAEQLAIIMQNPEFSVGKSALLIKQLQKTNPKVVEDALRILYKLEQTRNITPLLSEQAGSGSVTIPVAPKNSQMEFIKGIGIGQSSPQNPKDYIPIIPKEGSIEQIIETKGGWKPGMRKVFDLAMDNKDAKKVLELLPQVPKDYVKKFADQILNILRGK